MYVSSFHFTNLEGRFQNMAFCRKKNFFFFLPVFMSHLLNVNQCI